MKRYVFGRIPPRVMFLLIYLCTAVTSQAAPTIDKTAFRQEVSLNGAWESVISDNPAYPPPVKNMHSLTVPFLEYSNALQGPRYVWYKKTVDIPASFDGKQIILFLAGARFNASVWCDGRFIASRLEGFTPWEVDLTRHARAGRACLIEIRCQDWSAVFKTGYRLPPGADPNGETLRGVPRGKLLAPIGGHFYYFGLEDDVTLLARPAVHCRDVAVITSVRNNNRLTVTGDLAGGYPGLWVEAEVVDGGKKILTLPGRTGGRDNRFSLTAQFPGPRYWSPEAPHLYTLVLTLRAKKGGIVLDRWDTRFGFRELWASGPDLYLNGIKRRLLASSGWPLPRYQSDDEIRRAIRSLKEANTVAFRLHTQPWQRRWLDMADEEGLMIVEEGALWCDGGGGYAYNDERFWTNVDTHLAGMVRRDRNHPSLIMWSIENELLHCGAEHHCGCAEERLAEAGRRVKALDPTHLITYEADHDPLGAADVIGLHYPRELPENVDYPNTADWIGTSVTTGTAGGTAGSWNKDFFWDRKKPLYIGEYLWVFRQDYSAGTVFYGDEAYRDKNAFRDLAKARAWEIQTVAYRRAGVSGLCPWSIADNGGLANRDSPLFQAQQRAYAPVAIFQREFDTRFFSGEKVERTFDVFNDSARALRLEVRITMTGWAQGRVERFLLEPAGHKVITVTIPLPSRSAPGGLAFEAALYSGGKKLHSCTTSFQVYDKKPAPVPAGRRLLVFDPAGGWPAPEEKSRAVVLKNISELADQDPRTSLLVIGPHAFINGEASAGLPVIGSGNSGQTLFRRYLEKGGGILVLEQESLAGILPDLTLVNHASTMTFPVPERHPLLAGLGPDDFKFWRGDHYVTKREIRRPDRSGAVAVLVSGGLDCLDQTPLAAMTVGRGRIVLCQALAGAKYQSEPAARRLVANALAYLSPAPSSISPALTVADGPDAGAFRQTLNDLGLDYHEASAHPSPKDLANTEILILHGGGQKIEALQSILKTRLKASRPLTVYWHAPDSTSFQRLNDTLGLATASITDSSGPLTLTDEFSDALPYVLREDLTFLKPFTSDNWYRVVEYDAAVIDRALDISPPAAPADRHEIETWELSGAIVNPTEDKRAVMFATNGAAAGFITIPRPGLYRLRLAAWGSPAEGTWPAVQVRVDGKPVALVHVTERKPEEVAFLAGLPRGKHRIELAFINDLFRNGEDRNLFIDSLLVDREPVSYQGLNLLSLPPAITDFTPRPGQRVLIDCVRWDTNSDNRVRGLRYASALFAGLGAPFLPPGSGAEWLNPPRFVVSGAMSVFSRTETTLNLGSAGMVTAPFTCAAAGRYSVLLRGWSTPLKGVYAKALVRLDGRRVSEIELTSGTNREFMAGLALLSEGRHELSVEFTNDQWAGPGGEDRNLYLTGAGFRRER